MLGLGVLSRPNIFPVWFCLLGLWLHQQSVFPRIKWKETFFWCLKSGIPVAAAVGLLLFYNKVRFDDWMDFGYVTINGALCFIGEEIVRCKEIAPKYAQLAVEDAQEKSYGLIVIGENDVAVLDPNGEVDRIFRQELAVNNLNEAKPLNLVRRQRILQLTAFFTEDYETRLMPRIPGCISGRWHPAFTDITAQGADKGKGILAMAAHLGLDPQYTMAFGDGGNDTAMVKAAGVGVAMGNALDSLKQVADYTTSSVDDNGILNALRHFHLISSVSTKPADNTSISH